MNKTKRNSGDNNNNNNNNKKQHIIPPLHDPVFTRIKDDTYSYKIWSRKPLPLISPETDSIAFKMMDINYTIGKSVPGMPGIINGSVPIVHAYGVTSNGNSVQCNIHNFYPHFKVKAPNGFTENQLEEFRVTVNRHMQRELDNGVN